MQAEGLSLFGPVTVRPAMALYIIRSVSYPSEHLDPVGWYTQRATMNRPIRAFTLGIIYCCIPVVFAQTQWEVLVNSRGTHAVHHYSLDGTFLGEFIAANAGGLNSPEDILFHPDGSVLVTGFGNTAIKRYDGATGAYLGEFSAGYSLAAPSKMSLGPDSLIYVTQWGTTQNKVVRFNLDGTYIGEFTSVGTPNGLDHFWDELGRFYISVYGNGSNGYVRRFDADGNDLGIFISTTFLDGPTDLLPQANGDVLVQDWPTGTVKRFDPTGQYVGPFVTGLTNPEGHDFLPSGTILMGDWGVDAVHMIDTLGNNLGYFTSGNGLTDPNCVRLRAVPLSGLADEATTDATLSVVPSIGSGPFELRAERELSHGALVSVLDVAGRVEHEFVWPAGTKAVPFTMPDKPKKPCGRYVVVVRNGELVMRTTVVITE